MDGDLVLAVHTAGSLAGIPCGGKSITKAQQVVVGKGSPKAVVANGPTPQIVPKRGEMNGKSLHGAEYHRRRSRLLACYQFGTHGTVGVLVKQGNTALQGVHV